MSTTFGDTSYVDKNKMMYKYTPKKQILRDMQVKRVGRWWDTEYQKRLEILKRFHLQDYAYTIAIAEWYPKTVFYSKIKLKQVPVNGYLFPVEMFDEHVL